MPALAAAGKLDRTLRVIARANALCPEEEPRTWTYQVEALAEIGRTQEARELALRITSSPQAHADARRSAEMVLGLPAKRDDAFSGEALLAAGLAAKASGDFTRAQRLFDRAVQKLEQESGGARVALDASVVFHRTERVLPRFERDPGMPVAWSPDAKLLAVGDANDVVLFETQQWQPRRRLVGHTEMVTDLAFTPDGRTLVSGSRDATLRVWPLGLRGPPAVMANDYPVDGFALSPDGLTLATASGAAHQVRIWRLGEKVARRVIDGVIALPIAFSPDGATLATGNKLWSGDSFSTPNVLKSGDQSPWAVAFSPDGRTLATQAGQGLALWSRVRDEPPRWVGGGSGGTSSAMAYSPDGKYIANWIEGPFIDQPAPGPLVLWALGPPDTMRMLEDPTYVYSLAFSPDGRSLAVGLMGSGVKVWGLDMGIAVGTVKLGGRRSTLPAALAIAPDGRHIAIASEDRAVRLWDLSSSGAPRLFRSDTEPGGYDWRRVSMSFSPDGTYLDWRYLTWKDENVFEYSVNLQSGDPPRLVGQSEKRDPAWDDYTRRVRVCSPDGMRLVDGAVLITRRFPSRDCESPDALTPAASTTSLDTDAVSAGFAPDGEWFALGSSDGAVHLWSVLRKREELALVAVDVPSTASYAFSPFGYAAVFGEDARQRIVCRIGDDSYPLDLCEERFIVPNLVPRVMAGDYSFRLP